MQAKDSELAEAQQAIKNEVENLTQQLQSCVDENQLLRQQFQAMDEELEELRQQVLITHIIMTFQTRSAYN